MPQPIAALAGLPWPLPALAAWAAAWLVWAGCGAAGVPAVAAALAATAAGALLAWHMAGRWRCLIAAAGFPASALALGALGHWPAWIWLLLLLPPALAYPLRAWRDAPFFPTPAGALDGLDTVIGAPARVLDAGCGLGHGLAALRRLWPQADLQGVEWSPLLALLAARRCPGARVRRGDMWALSWAGFDLVYLFQRPESMPRAWAKARRELPPQAWLVSLEFPVPGQVPHACLQAPGRRALWVYRTGQDTARSIGAAAGR
jgi:SAM-dependent methyltransferase